MMKANWERAVCAMLLVAGTAQGAATDAQKCQASKNEAAGKYAACRQNAEKGFALTADAVKYGAAITKCEDKFTAAWQKAIDKATAASATCPDSPLVAADYKPVIDEHTDNIATALGGGGLADCSGDLATCTTDLGTCNGSLGTCQTDLAVYTGMPTGSNVTGSNGLPIFPIPDGIYTGGKTATAADTNLVAGHIKSGTSIFGVAGNVVPLSQTCGNNLSEGSELCDGTDLNGKTCATEAPSTPYGTLACNGGCTALVSTGCVARFVDNGDGTVTDNSTKLVWEKKSDDGSIHDWDNLYTWGVTGAPLYPPDGTAFTVFQATLNTAPCFAGQCDWRVPSLEELQTIVDSGAFYPATYAEFNTGCAPGCTVTTCSCTQSDGYWSATTTAGGPNFAWGVYFNVGGGNFGPKTVNDYVRAVRGGL